MKKNTRRLFRYIKEYQWSNIFAMIKNSRLDPEVCDERFSGKLAVITGATSGIGYLTARKYASMGANLICVNRSEQKSEKLKLEIESEFATTCNYIIADLSRLEDIHKAASELGKINTPIDVLIHNAGIYLTKKEITPDGIEKTLAVHYLSSFIINYMLLEKLKAQDHSRIILVSSEGHRFAAWGLHMDDLNWENRRYSGLKSYGSAKLAQLLTMLVFDDKCNKSGVTINAMHPGAVYTDTGKDNGPVYRWIKNNMLDKRLRSPDISAEALYYLGVAKEVKTISGKFFNLTKEELPTPPALDKEAAYELWEKSLEMSRLGNIN
jgi:NAD(P)-dependent dehydrogenase (short-subunit alcohol dehydrogenase family)